jgi:hypothetical protein
MDIIQDVWFAFDMLSAFLGVVPPLFAALAGRVGRRKWDTDEHGNANKNSAIL